MSFQNSGLALKTSGLVDNYEKDLLKGITGYYGRRQLPNFRVHSSSEWELQLFDRIQLKLNSVESLELLQRF